MKNINIFFISIILLLNIQSNIWDNIYSQSKSPHFSIPDNFQITLMNEKDGSTAGELFVSSNLNLIKFSFILDESNSKDAFIHLLIDFKEGKIYFDTEEKCVYQYYDIVEQISPKFIINAYDLLSYFSEDDNYYHYVVINPLSLADVDDDEANKLSKLLKTVLFDLEKNILESKTIYDKPFYGDFMIDKTTLTIKSVAIKARNTLNTFNTLYKVYDVEKEKFKAIHNLNECTEYKV